MPSTLKSLKLLADPTRLRILMLLEQEALSVAELQELLGMGQSRISTQLSQMKTGGLVSDERSGKNNIYSCTAGDDLMKVARVAASEIPEASTDQSALRHLLRKRRDKSRAYFDELAGRFGKDYVPGRSWKALAEAFIKILNYKVVADLGAGEGTLAQLLAQRAEKVIAVDLSPKMVEFGQQLAVQHGLSNLEFRVGDIENPQPGPAPRGTPADSGARRIPHPETRRQPYHPRPAPAQFRGSTGAVCGPLAGLRRKRSRLHDGESRLLPD
jgi:DNA-binding transcriptional ArsR family regulator